MVTKMRNTIMRKDDQKGFTLIELIVVMAILAILAALAIPKFTGVMAKSKQDANNSNVDLIAHAAETYYDSHAQTMPADIAALVSNGYIKENPTEPVSNTASGYSLAAGSASNKIIVKPGKCDAATGIPEAAGDEYTF